MKVSQSKVTKWRTCKLAYYYSYVMKLRPRRPARRALQFGRMAHEMIEADANGDDPFQLLRDWMDKHKDMFEEEKEHYGDILGSVQMIMQAYWEYWKDDPLRFVRREKKSAEHYIELDIGNGLKLIGYVDAVGKAKGLRWLVEHKSFSRKPSEDHRWRNVQAAVYIHALREMGWPEIHGIVWDYIKSKEPTKPAILKNRTMSKAKIETLPAAVYKVINDNEDIVEADCQAQLEMARASLPSYFSRVYQPVNHDVMSVLWNEFVVDALEMADNHGKRLPRCIGQHCEWCDYNPLCRLELEGGDVDYAIENDYIKKKREG